MSPCPPTAPISGPCPHSLPVPAPALHASPSLRVSVPLGPPPVPVGPHRVVAGGTLAGRGLPRTTFRGDKYGPTRCLVIPKQSKKYEQEEEDSGDELPVIPLKSVTVDDNMAEEEQRAIHDEFVLHMKGCFNKFVLMVRASLVDPKYAVKAGAEDKEAEDGDGVHGSVSSHNSNVSLLYIFPFLYYKPQPTFLQEHWHNTSVPPKIQKQKPQGE
ncbi:hypothetical protein B0H16DRAFT_1480624 [Mycena metata]|uniref:Uncharacterized protein n=1 Tax=Mycena metata TaxID=1033252 RepID=A0AAD7H3P4_9AGAR|nr:hypothetical protein B0H16DRAFT_1480624 [Mycena metata]